MSQSKPSSYERIAAMANRIGKNAERMIAAQPSEKIKVKPHGPEQFTITPQTDTRGATFGRQGLILYEVEKDKDGNEVMREDGTPKMVVSDMTKFAKKQRRKSFGSGDYNGASDPLIMWKPGAQSRINPANAMENYTGLNYAAISALADEISNISWELYSFSPDGNHQKIEQHEILDLLDAPNADQTGPEFKFTLAAHLELTGNVYILMLNKRGLPITSENEKPVQLYTLNPGKIDVKIDDSTFPFRIVGYNMLINGREFPYEKFQVIQLKRPNPSSPLIGIGTTQAIAEYIDVDNDGIEFNRQFFIHGAYLTGTIQTEATDEDQIDSMRESFNEQHAGVRNSNKVLMLMKGMKFTSHLDPKDMAFEKLLAVTKERIHAGTRVSSTILGTAEADTNRATAETADYVFAKRLVKPRMIMMVSQVTEMLVSRWGDGLFLSFTDPTPEDKSFRIQEMQATIGSAPLLNINEAREKYMGLGPIPGGDTIFRPQTMVPLDTPVADPTANPGDGTKPNESKPADGDDDNAKPNKPDRPKKTLAPIKLGWAPVRARFHRNQNARKEFAESLSKAMIDNLRKIQKFKPWKLSFKEYAVIAKEVEKRNDSARKALQLATIEYQDKQCLEVLGNLSKVMKAVNPNVLFDAKQSVQIVIDFATPILTKLATEEGTAASQSITGIGVDVMTNEAYAAAVKRSIELLGQKYTETTLDDLKTTIETSLKNGDSIVELEAQVRKYYNEANQNRAPMLARTETFRISNTATKEAWKETGVVKTMKWFTSPLDNVCPFCAALNGKEIPIDQNFFNMGDQFDLPSGETMQLNYDDVSAPPLHPNCGCYLQPGEVSVT